MNLALLWAIRSGLLLLLLTPLVYSMSTVFPFVVFKAIWARSLIEVIFAAWVILAVRTREYRPARSWLVVIFALFVLATLVSGYFGVSFQRTFWGNYERMQGVFDLAHWGALLFVLASVVRGVAQWRLLLNAVVGLGLVMGLIGVAQRLGISPVFFDFIQEKPRLDITLGNPTYVGAYMTVISILACGLLADSFRSRESESSDEQRARRARPGQAGRRRDARRLRAARIFWGATAVLAVWVIGETGSRGAVVALVGGVLIAGLLYAIWGGHKRLRIACVASIAIVVVAVPLLLFARGSDALRGFGSISPVLERTFGSGGEGALTERAAGLRIGVEAFAARPVTGWGGDNFVVPFRLYSRASDSVYGPTELDRAHSQPLDVLATTGSVGFVFYAALWGWLTWLMMSGIPRASSTRMLRLFGAAALGAYFVGTLFLFETSSTFLLFIVLAAWMGSTEPAMRARADLGLAGDVLLPPGAGPLPVEVPPEERARVKGRRARRRREQTRRPRDRIAGVLDEYLIPAAVVALLLTSLYVLNYRLFRASQLFVLSGTPDQVAEYFRYFSPLAPYGQIALFNLLAQKYAGESADQRSLMVQLVDREQKGPLEAEPDNYRLHLSLANFNREAASDLPERMAIARQETQELARLGPELFRTHAALIQQALAERDLDAARTAVLVWKTEHPKMDEASLNKWDESVEILAEELATGGG